MTVQNRCWRVTLQWGAVSDERCWEQLEGVPNFQRLSREEFDAVVEHKREQVRWLEETA